MRRKGASRSLDHAVPAQSLEHPLAVLRVHPQAQVARQGGAPQDLLRRVARDPREAFVGGQVDPVGQAVDVHGVGTGLEGLGEFLLRRTQGGLGLPLFRDVPDDPHQGEGPPALVPLQLPGTPDPPGRAVGLPDDGIPQVEALAALDDPGHVGLKLLPEGGGDQIQPALEVAGMGLVDAQDLVQVGTALPGIPGNVPHVGPDPSRLLGVPQEAFALLERGLALATAVLRRPGGPGRRKCPGRPPRGGLASCWPKKSVSAA